MREAQNKCLPLLGAPKGGGQNLNCKFKTFGFLDTVKVHTNYHTSTTFYLIQTRLAKKQQSNFLCSSLFSFILKVKS